MQGISEKKAKLKVEEFFPEAALAESRQVYIPVYRVTLRDGNRVRIFWLDGMYGKPASV